MFYSAHVTPGKKLVVESDKGMYVPDFEECRNLPDFPELLDGELGINIEDIKCCNDNVRWSRELDLGDTLIYNRVVKVNL